MEGGEGKKKKERQPGYFICTVLGERSMMVMIMMMMINDNYDANGGNDDDFRERVQSADRRPGRYSNN